MRGGRRSEAKIKKTTDSPISLTISQLKEIATRAKTRSIVNELADRAREVIDAMQSMVNNGAALNQAVLVDLGALAISPLNLDPTLIMHELKQASKKIVNISDGSRA